MAVSSFWNSSRNSEERVIKTAYELICRLDATLIFLTVFCFLFVDIIRQIEYCLFKIYQFYTNS